MSLLNNYCKDASSLWKLAKISSLKVRKTVLFNIMHIRIQMGALGYCFKYTRLLGDTSLIIVTILTLAKNCKRYCSRYSCLASFCIIVQWALNGNVSVTLQYDSLC